MILEVWNRCKPLNDSDQNPREGTIHASVGSVPFSATPSLQYFASKRRLWITKNLRNRLDFRSFEVISFNNADCQRVVIVNIGTIHQSFTPQIQCSSPIEQPSMQS